MKITLSKAQYPKAWFSGFYNVHSVVDGIVVDGTIVVGIWNFFFR